MNEEVGMTVDPHAPVTQLLARARAGDAQALGEAYSAVYDELKRAARSQLRRMRDAFETTALVHEAYLKLFGGQPVSARDRSHFLQIAARAMRQVLVDHARGRRAAKRGRGSVNLPLETELIAAEQPASLDLVALNIALDRLAALDERQARIVELRFFADVDIRSTAEALGISAATVKRDWEVAKAWLRRELRTIDAEAMPEAVADAGPTLAEADAARPTGQPGHPSGD
jgi:RNA polymerase sigma factor (TIGR02999 family)